MTTDIMSILFWNQHVLILEKSRVMHAFLTDISQVYQGCKSGDVGFYSSVYIV